MKTLIVLLLALVAITEAASNDEAESDDEALSRDWKSFKVEYQKAYESEAEEKHRKNIFIKNKRQINVHNFKYEQSSVSFKLAVNEYADMAHDDFVRTMTGFKPESFEDYEEPVGANIVAPSSVTLPTTVDWRNKGAVTGIKAQGMCGACWAFSAVGALEGQYFIKSGQLVPLSEQNLIDCSCGYGANDGCTGGTMANAFQYVMDNKGIEAEAFYPYLADDNSTCSYDPWKIGASSSGFVNLPAGNEEQLKWAVATIGPIAAGINADPDTFFNYGSGIYFDRECTPKDINHAVVVVGYGSENGKNYWLVKNSWGTSWGQQGYMQLARNAGNQCGIASVASYPIV